MKVIGGKWGLPASTFDRYWKIAKLQHTEAQAAIKKELAEIDKQAAIEARKKAIMTVEERKMVLTKIANGTLKLTKWWVGKDYESSKQVVPDYMDRKNAISELNKMEGDYAPTKTELTGKGGKPIEIDNPSKVDYSKLSDEVLDAIINASKNKQTH